MRGIFWGGQTEDNYLGHLFAEIYKDGVYFEHLSGKKDLTILEIGANIGVATQYFANFAKDVYSVEPAKEHFECLSKMVEFNKLKNVHPINKAIAQKSGELKFFHSKNRTMHSFHRTSNLDDGTSEKVEAITIKKLFDDYKIKHADLVNLDIEGEEFNVLCSKEFSEVSPKIDKIIVELHSWVNRNYNQAREALRQNGFKTMTIPNDANIIIGYK